ncbi:MAG: protein kinase, partial [Myxococcota bacterium]
DDEVGDTTVGTIAYLSPEQARGDATDIRSDIYSLGITLYQLVVGEIPFEGDDDHETMAKRFIETLKSSKLAKASPHMHYFIQKMMAQDPDHRYQTPEELIADVEDQIRGKKTLTVNPLTNSAADLELKKPFAAPTSKKKVIKRSDRLGRKRRR